ncbi:MAG: agmatinase [Dehalococcoidia bacterium]|nr:agmatinase [Dehalococcoidia bacterium]
MAGENFSPPLRFAAVPGSLARLRTSRIAVLPVPYDATTDWRSGQREGPQAIMEASQYMEHYDVELGLEISEVGIHTLPPVEPLMGDPQAMVRRVARAIAPLARAGKVVALLGGEHTLTLGAVLAYKDRFPGLSVLHLDAHADLRDWYLGTRYSHATVLRRVVEECPAVAVGVRSLCAEEARIVNGGCVRVWYGDTWDEAQVMGALSSQVYITVDLDVLDPSIMAAVGTPEPGGLSWESITGLLKAVTRQRQVVGFDVVELCPREGPGACAYLAAKLAYKLMGYITHPLVGE